MAKSTKEAAEILSKTSHLTRFACTASFPPSLGFPNYLFTCLGPCQVAEVVLCFGKQTTSNKLCLTKEKDTHTLLIC